MRRFATLVALLTLALAVLPAGADARSPRVSVKFDSRAALAEGKRVRIALPVSRTRTRVRVVVGLASTRGRPLRVRTLSVAPRRGARRTIRRLVLSRAARRRLAGCRSYVLTVRVVRPGGRTVARGRRSLPARAGCGGRRREAGDDDARSSGRCDVLDPAVCLQPFPNNHFTTRAQTPTGLRLDLQREAMPANRAGRPIEPADYNAADGFSPGQKIITRVPGLDSIEAFRRTGAVPIDDPMRSFDRNAPIVVLNADTGERHMIWSEVDANPADPEQRNLLIRPAVNFDEGARYIVALRNLKGADGATLEPRRTFRALRDDVRTDDPEIEERRPAMRRIFATLGRAGIARDELYLAWDFTVASAPSITGRMLSIRDRAFAALGDANLADRRVDGRPPPFTINPDLPSEPLAAAPGLPSAGPVGPPSPRDLDGIVDYESGPIARTVRGRITVPCFLDQPACPSGSRFALGPDGTPTQLPGNVTTYDFTCNIPRREGRLRPGLYGHGLFGGQGEVFQGQLKDLSFEKGFLFCAVDWNGMATRDIPNTATVLQDLSRFPTLIDHVQQGFLGFLYLGRALIHPDGFAKEPAFRDQIDTTELFYDGNSQGGIYGGTLTAIAPDFERAVLGVPGMNYSTLLRRSTDFATYAEGEFGTDTEAGLYDNYPDELERPLVLALIQNLWDRGDPNGFAHHMTTDPLPNTPAHKVLLHVGFGDHQVADVTTEVEARTIGARVHRPGLAPGRERYRERPYPGRPMPELFQGIGSLGDPGYRADGSGLIFWDIGPPRTVDGKSRGTPAPWAKNVPPSDGQDPHESPRRTKAAQEQKSQFLRPGGRIVDVCGGPCRTDDHSGG